jgi:hypothetical protein
MNKIGPIIYAFSHNDIKAQKLAGFLALFNQHALAQTDSASDLLNSLHISLDIPKLRHRVSFERPEVRAFCQRLVQECYVLPWVCSLSTQLYREIVYATLPEIRVTYSDSHPGEYVTRFCVEDMQAVVDPQSAALQIIARQAQIRPQTHPKPIPLPPRR